jgi:hypothetical protein
MVVMAAAKKEEDFFLLYVQSFLREVATGIQTNSQMALCIIQQAVGGKSSRATKDMRRRRRLYTAAFWASASRCS